MTTDLWILTATVGWTWGLIVLAATPNLLKDMAWAAGNRHEPLPRDAWAARSFRAAENMKENLPLFAILIIVAHVSGTSDDMTTLGAWIFLGARIAHGLVYTLGVPWVRTTVWAVSVIGMFMIVYSIAV